MRNGSNKLRKIGDLEIDLERKIVWINDRSSGLPAKAVELLCALVENEGEIISKDELLNRVWQDSFVEEGVLPQNVYLLRKTLAKVGLSGDLIQTVPRRGYRFVDGRGGTNERSEITIEREVFEQTYISETDIAPDETSSDAIRPDTLITSGRSLRRTLIVGAAVVSTLIIAAAFFGMPRFMNTSGPRPISEYQGQLDYEKITQSGRAFFVGLSHDRENAAYVVHTADGKYALNLYHLGSKSETTIVHPQEGQIFNIQFSPDGKSIFYVELHSERKTGVFRIPIYGGTPQLVTRELIHHYMLSPDGEWIAYYRREPGDRAHMIEICRSGDCSEKRIVTSRVEPHGFVLWGAAPAWSPDGKKFAAAAHTREVKTERGRVHLVEIDIETGEQKDLYSPDWYAAHQAYWQPDGQGLYVMVREAQGDPMQLWQLQYPSGQARNITNDQNNYREFRVASDESFILATTWAKSENLSIVSVDDPSQVKQLTFDTDGLNGASALCWTRDGRSLVFSKASGSSIGHLWVIDLDTLSQRQLTFDEKALPHYADTTPDGKSVIFGYNKTGRWNIWKVDLNGENLTQLTDGSYQAAPEVSPDGKWLYYLADGLRKQPIDGGESVKIMDRNPGTVRVSPADPNVFAAYFHDGNEKEANPWKHVLFDERNTGKYIELKIPATLYFEWKPDGSGLYFTDNGESFNNIWFLDLADGSRVQVTQFADQRIGNFSVSPDGRTFALARGSSIGSVLKLAPK